MLNFKKTMALLGATLMLLQGVTGIGLSNNKAEAATYKPAMQEIMSRPYPRVMGNQWHTNPDGTFSSGNHEATVDFAAKYLDFVSLNRAGGTMNDLFLDFAESTRDPNKGLLRTKNDIYRSASAQGRRVYVLAYHNMTDVWNYQSVSKFPSQNFWMKPDGQNIGTWDYMDKHNYWLRSTDGTIVTYPGYTSAQRRFWDSRKAEVQNYWAQHAKGIVDQGFDGVFADNWLRTGFAGPDRDAVQRGWDVTGGKFKQLAPDKILVGNSPHLGVFTTRDASMLEDRIAPATSGDKSIPSYFTYSDQSAAVSQVCLDTYWDEAQGPFETFRVPMALLTDNVIGLPTRTKQGTLIGNGIQQYIQKLGKIGYPKGPRYKANNVWQRDFDGGKVLVNDTTSAVTVNLTSGVFKDVNGVSVNSVTLPALRGIVLKGSAQTQPAPQAPAAAGNLAVSLTKGATTGNYYANLTWTDNSSNETGFKVLQSVNSTTSFQEVKSLGSNVSGVAIDLGATPTVGTYNYQVIAVNAVGSAQPSNTASVQVSAPAPTPTAPTAPSNCAVTSVTKSATSGNYFVSLTWKDNSNNETGFQILQSINSTSDFKVIKTPAANGTSYGINIGSTPTPGTYHYKVIAVGASGNSLDSNIASTPVRQDVATVPAAAGNLAVSLTKGATTGNYYANLTWTDNSSNETGFKVLQSVNSTTSFQEVKSLGSNVSSVAIDLGANPTVGAYNYQVVAVNAVGSAQPSNTASVQVSAPAPTPTAPIAPSNCAVTSVTKGATTGNYFVNLAWTDNSSNETGFQVQQAVNSTTNFQIVKTVAADTTTWSADIGAAPAAGSYYRYRVIAANGTVLSAASNVATTQVGTPNAPTTLALTQTKGTAGNVLVNLTWKDNSGIEAGFKVLQSRSATTGFAEVKTIPASTTSTSIDLGTAPAAGTYYYQVVAYSAMGNSSPTNTVSTQIIAPVATPAAPSECTVASVTKGATSGNYFVNLTWKDNSSNETGFEILQSINSTTNFQVIKTPATNGTSYGINIGATPTPGTYYYKVVAVGTAGKSVASNVASTPVRQETLAVPTAPGSLTTSAIKDITGKNAVLLRWQDNATNETGFNIYTSNSSTGSFTKVGTIGTANQSLIVHILNAISGSIYYQIKALNANGESAASNTSLVVIP